MFKPITCDNCNRVFQCEEWRILKRKNLFCSKKCEGEFRKKQSALNCECPICGKKFHIKPSQIPKGKSHYCSRECHRIAKTMYMAGELNHQFGLKGKKNASWKSDDRISVYGYHLIRDHKHPFANVDDFVFEHRIIAEKFLLNEENSVVINGIEYLSPEYAVHHIDFDKLNNNVNNLLVLNRGEHTKLHRSLNNDANLHKYCEKYKLDFGKVKQIRDYNKIKYKYNKKHDANKRKEDAV